jgi:hypothetical protein
VRNKWTYYAGVETPVKQLYSTIENDIDTTCFNVFGNTIITKTTVSQTAADLQNGYSYTVTVAVQGNMPTRIWNVVVSVSRESTTTSTTT